MQFVLEVILEVALHDGGHRQESATKDNLMNCIANLE
jgi:hypothetical protein